MSSLTKIPPWKYSYWNQLRHERPRHLLQHNPMLRGDTITTTPVPMLFGGLQVGCLRGGLFTIWDGFQLTLSFVTSWRLGELAGTFGALCSSLLLSVTKTVPVASRALIWQGAPNLLKRLNCFHSRLLYQKANKTPASTARHLWGLHLSHLFGHFIMVMAEAIIPLYCKCPRRLSKCGLLKVTTLKLCSGHLLHEVLQIIGLSMSARYEVPLWTQLHDFLSLHLLFFLIPYSLCFAQVGLFFFSFSMPFLSHSFLSLFLISAFGRAWTYHLMAWAFPYLASLTCFLKRAINWINQPVFTIKPWEINILGK